MTKRRKIIIAGLIVLAILSMVGLYILSQPNNPVVTQIQQSSIQNGATITLNGVVVNNFTSNSKQINKNGDRDIVKVNNYEIIYFPATKSFLISILASPFETNRQLAETEFLRRLNITKTDACKLTVDITTPAFANESEAGQNFKLSFCK